MNRLSVSLMDDVLYLWTKWRDDVESLETTLHANIQDNSIIFSNKGNNPIKFYKDKGADFEGFIPNNMMFLYSEDLSDNQNFNLLFMFEPMLNGDDIIIKGKQKLNSAFFS